MHLLNHLSCLIILVLTSSVLSDNDASTENNEIIPKESLKNIDETVRQALLRAIEKLEKQAAERYSSQEEDSKESNYEQEVEARVKEIKESLNSEDEILEESTTPDVAPTVQFFTAMFDEKLSKEQPLISFINREKQLKKKINTIVNLGSPDVIDVPNSKDKFQATRSIASDSTNEISSENKAEIEFQITKLKKKSSETTKPPTTTTTTTTTTTPRPTHNEDGENIELVDKKDIKIQEAPLVTAFTVDLDERGATKKVIPIIDRLSTIKQPVAESNFGPTISRFNVLPAEAQPPTLSPPEIVPQYRVNEDFQRPSIPPTNASTNSNPNTIGFPLTKQQLDQKLPPSNFPLVNNYLIERHRALEQQIYQLQLQAKQQQEEIVRQLQIIEQQSLRQQQQQFPPQTILPPADATAQKGSNNELSIRPSIELTPPVTKSPEHFGISPNQQLPSKDAPRFNNEFNNDQFNRNDFFIRKNNDFGINNNGNFANNGNPNIFGVNDAQRFQQQSHQSIVQIQPSSQLPFLPNLSQTLVQHPPELSPFQSLPQNNYQPFQNQPIISPNPNLLQQHENLLNQQQQQHFRQFRQESDTGNFGINQLKDNQNRFFNHQQFIPQNSNQLQNVDANYQTGISFDHTPELNVISHILALNHGIIPFAQQNLRYQGGQAGF